MPFGSTEAPAFGLCHSGGEKVSYYSNLGASTWPVVFRRTRGSFWRAAFDVFMGVTVQNRTGLCRTKSLKTISLTSAHSSSLIKAQECCKSVCFTACGATSLFPYAAAAAAAAAWTLWHCWTQHILSLLQVYLCMCPAEAVLHSSHYAEWLIQLVARVQQAFLSL